MAIRTSSKRLGAVSGPTNDPPYIVLSGDDRTGDVASGETMRINGVHWSKIRRLAIFALIYDGVPNWLRTDGVVTVTMPNQPPIEVRMTDVATICGYAVRCCLRMMPVL